MDRKHTESTFYELIKANKAVVLHTCKGGPRPPFHEVGYPRKRNANDKNIQPCMTRSNRVSIRVCGRAATRQIGGKKGNWEEDDDLEGND